MASTSGRQHCGNSTTQGAYAVITSRRAGRREPAEAGSSRTTEPTATDPVPDRLAVVFDDGRTAVLGGPPLAPRLTVPPTGTVHAAAGPLDEPAAQPRRAAGTRACGGCSTSSCSRGRGRSRPSRWSCGRTACRPGGRSGPRTAPGSCSARSGRPAAPVLEPYAGYLHLLPAHGRQPRRAVPADRRRRPFFAVASAVVAGGALVLLAVGLRRWLPATWMRAALVVAVAAHAGGRRRDRGERGEPALVPDARPPRPRAAAAPARAGGAPGRRRRGRVRAQRPVRDRSSPSSRWRTPRGARRAARATGGRCSRPGRCRSRSPSGAAMQVYTMIAAPRTPAPLVELPQRRRPDACTCGTSSGRASRPSCSRRVADDALLLAVGLGRGGAARARRRGGRCPPRSGQPRGDRRAARPRVARGVRAQPAGEPRRRRPVRRGAGRAARRRAARARGRRAVGGPVAVPGVGGGRS